VIFSPFIFHNVMIKFWKSFFSFSGGGVVIRYHYRLIFFSTSINLQELISILLDK